MTPKEKAKDLVDKYDTTLGVYNLMAAKQCALITVNEMKEAIGSLAKPEYVAFTPKEKFDVGLTEYKTHLHGYEMLYYWEQVDEEINKL